MKLFNEKNELIVPLYHGTSSLFLNSIVLGGIGGSNPIEDWDILGCAKDLDVLLKVYLEENYLFGQYKSAWNLMLRQQADDKMNFQHGDTYLSACKNRAIRNSVNNEYGSELLSRVLIFLDELRREGRRQENKEIYDSIEKLLRNYKKINKVAKLHREGHYPILSPILIKIQNVPREFLKGEGGGGPEEALEEIEISLPDYPSKLYDDSVQAANFRLISPLPKNRLEFFLIHVNKFENYMPNEYNLYQLKV